jgi:hypothetical protein
MQKYCDIIPDATGWIYVIDGVQFASGYHTCELAMRAAEVHLSKNDRLKSKIFRRRSSNGEMVVVSAGKSGISRHILNS